MSTTAAILMAYFIAFMIELPVDDVIEFFENVELSQPEDNEEVI